MSFPGLERTDRIIEPDPIFPLNDPNGKVCLNLLCAGRPNYMYISMDSIFRNSVFQTERKPDVFVYIDVLANGDNYIKAMLDVIGNFPVDGVFINKKHKGTVANYWASFNRAFSDGYDYCILIEEDWLITTDAIQWFYDVPKIASHYSLYRWEDRIGVENGKDYTILKNGDYFSWCVGFSKESFDFIYRIIKANGWYGLVNFPIDIPEIRRMNYIDWDAIFIPIFRHHQLWSIVPPKSCLAHFGCRTSNFMGYGSGYNMHERMFNGPPEKWLNNTIEIFNTTSSDEKTLLHFYPLSFNYR